MSYIKFLCLLLSASLLTLCVVHEPPNPDINIKIGLQSEQRETQNFLGGTVLKTRLIGIPKRESLLKQARWYTQKITKQTRK